MNSVIGSILASQASRSNITTGEVHIHRKDSREFSILEWKHTAEQDFQVPVVSSLVKLLVGKKRKFLACDALWRNRQQMDFRASARSQFAEDETLALWQNRIRIIFER